MRTIWLLGLSLALLAVSATRATAQVALEPQIGWNQGVHSHLTQGLPTKDSSVGPVFAGSWYAGNWRDPSRTHRFGMSFSTQQVKIFAIPAGTDGHETKDRLTSIQGVFERAPLRGPRADLVLQLAIGLAWHTSHPNDSGDWPQLMSAFSLGIKTIFPIAEAVSLTLSARGNLISTDASATYPFKSGMMLLAGVEFFTP